MSSVYKATDTRLDRDVAAKIIHPHLSDSPQFIGRFKREAAAVAKLRHGNIVQIFDFGRENDISYIILELVRGNTLQARLNALSDAGEQMPLDEVLRLGSGIGDALAYAHKKGVTHRDIKPANVLLNSDGDPILTDFGLAKLAGGTRFTMTGAVMGTARYMSPEQIKAETVDHRSDIYSFGVTLFEMLSGRPPFEAETAVTTMMMHLTNPPPDIRTLSPDRPAWISDIIAKALEKEPADRYQTADEMLAALRAGASQSAAAPAPPPETTAVSPLTTPTMIVPPAAQTAAHANGNRAVAEQTAVSPSAPPVKKRKKTGWALAGVAVLALFLGIVAASQFLPGMGDGQNLTGSVANVNDGGSNSVVAAPLETAAPTTNAANASATPKKVNAIAPTPTREEATATAVQADTETATDTPTPPPTATDTSTPTNTPPPTPTNTPTPRSSNAAGAAHTGEGLPYGFGDFGVWVRGDENNGSFTQSSEQAHNGSFSAKLAYDFASAENDYVVFMQLNPIDGSPNALKLWVYGDGEGHYLNAWIRDDDGETWQVPFGKVTHTGWKEMTGLIDPEQNWPWGHISGPKNDVVDYPITFRGFVLDDYANDYEGTGEIYLDDLRAVTVADGGTAQPTTSPSASPTAVSAPPGDIGRIIYTANGRLYTTDPDWAAPVDLGAAVSNSCGSPATTASQSYNLYFGLKCGIGGVGSGRCTSPNGVYDIITTAIDEQQTSISVGAAGGEGTQFIFQGEVDRAEGIRWAPASDTFLFVVGDTVHLGFPGGGYNQVVSPAYQPMFSADGVFILYRKPVGAGVNDVFISDADGTNHRNLTNSTTVDKQCAAWVN